ncbi:MAG: hypothetical protein A2Z14_06225 [Chloroflexi bacterium RBG_16_48_8]|nr:MAG: hypothetical protein A2Z14_06225 [Chloroflexi bacterium RBG_16_48_8]
MIRQPGAALSATAHHWTRAILNLIFPPTCVGCREPGVEWCDRCNQALRRLSKSACNYCGSPLPHHQKECTQCVEFPDILRIRSYAYYEGSLIKAILHLKYRPNRRLAEIMGSWLAELAIQEGMEAERVIAVPLGRKRLNQRGYNQVDLIADGMAKKLGIVREKKALKRIRETQSQVGLDPVTRRLNVHNAFQANQQGLKDQCVFLVDDLFTTGATLLACTSALQEVGVRKVYGLTVARA